MAGITTRRVGPGERIDDVVTTDWLGAVGQAVRQVSSLRGSTGGSANAGQGGYTNVLIRNDTEDNAPMFGILGIDDGFVIDPGDNLNEWKRTPILKGVAPTVDHAGKFVILTEPIAAGKIGSCCVYGILTKIDVVDETHGFADVTDGETGYLTSGESGLCRIIQKEGPPDEPPDEGEPDLRWALVAFGGGGGGGACPTNWFKLKPFVGTTSTTATFTLMVTIIGGTYAGPYTTGNILVTASDADIKTAIEALTPFTSDPTNYKVQTNGDRLPGSTIGIQFFVPSGVSVKCRRHTQSVTTFNFVADIQDRMEAP